MIPGADGLVLSLFEIVLADLFSLLAELVVLIFRLTSPEGLLAPLFITSLVPMPVIRMSSSAPPMHMIGILVEGWYRWK